MSLSTAIIEKMTLHNNRSNYQRLNILLWKSKDRSRQPPYFPID